MTRKEWKRSFSALRKLLSELNPEVGRYQSIRRIQYKFGAVYHRAHGMWYLYHGVSDNVFATIKLRPGENPRTIIRVRPTSFYAPFLSSVKMVGETIVIQSTNMSSNRNWVREQLRDRVRQSIGESRRARRATTVTQSFQVANGRITQRMRDSYMARQGDRYSFLANPNAVNWFNAAETNAQVPHMEYGVSVASEEQVSSDGTEASISSDGRTLFISELMAERLRSMDVPTGQSDEGT